MAEKVGLMPEVAEFLRKLFPGASRPEDLYVFWPCVTIAWIAMGTGTSRWFSLTFFGFAFLVPMRHIVTRGVARLRNLNRSSTP